MSDLRLEDTSFEDLKKSKLVKDLRDFADDWGYGIKQLGKHTYLDLAESLKSVRAKKKGE